MKGAMIIFIKDRRFTALLPPWQRTKPAPDIPRAVQGPAFKAGVPEVEDYVRLLGGVISISIALMAVSIQAVRTAIGNPVTALRNE